MKKEKIVIVILLIIIVLILFMWLMSNRTPKDEFINNQSNIVKKVKVQR